jgi:membrane-associated phospholipid phosphatase
MDFGSPKSVKQDFFLITSKNKFFWGLLGGFLTSTWYMVSNHFHFFEPQYLIMTRLDDVIPFIPETIWIYASETLLFFVTYVLIKDTRNLNCVFYAFMLLQFMSCLIFFLFPTTYPRDLFPLLLEQTDQHTFRLFQELREADTPANCCPSLHVSSVLVCALAFLKEQKEKFAFFFTWAMVIAFSTVTTKQHYVVDVVTGWLMGLSCYCFVYYGFLGHSLSFLGQDRNKEEVA